MSERKDESPDGGTDSGVGISDDQLPDDLVPGDDNPLAEGLPPGEAPHELVPEGGLEGLDQDGDSEDDETPGDR